MTTLAPRTDAGSRVLIVGASHAGVQTSVALRAAGHTGPVTLVGAEPHRPYQRPPLSKDWLTGATSSAGTLTVPGADLPGVCVLRDLDDAVALRARLTGVRHAVVVGGGFIGLETAAVLRAAGCEVTLLEAADRLLARACGPETAAHLLARHRADGIDVRFGVRVQGVLGAGRVTGVELATGELPADLVVVGVSAQARTDLALRMGLRCADGVVVDERAVASDGRTVAVGDVANLPHPAPGAAPGTRVRFESVSNTVDQAEVAAATLLGRTVAYPGVPWFWSTQGRHTLQIAGVSDATDSRVVRHDPATGRFATLYYRAGRLVAADAVDAPAEFVAVKKALATGGHIPPHRAADVSVTLRGLVEPAVAVPA